MDTMYILNCLIVCARIFILIPLFAFLFRYFEFRKTNGLVWKVRRMTLIFVSSIVLLVLNALVQRFQLLLGYEIINVPNSLFTLFVTLTVGVAAWFCLYEIHQIRDGSSGIEYKK